VTIQLVTDKATATDRPGTAPDSPGTRPPGRAPAPRPDEPVDRPRRITTRTVDDLASSIGSGLGAFALVWVLYERVLPLSGPLGFVICTYVAYLVIYAVVTAISNPRPVVVDRLVAAVVTGGAVVVAGALVTTLGFVFIKGWSALHHWNFYTQDMAGVRPTSPLSQGGVKHAIVGTAIQVGIAVAIALPLGLGTAVFMNEVGGRISHAVRTVVEAMTALPDVLAGLFVYTVLIIGLQWERSGFAVAIALAVTMIPVIARSGEVALNLVPMGVREASLALGASHWQTVRRVVIPTARSGLATSLILGIARVTGETAPLLIVSGASTFYNSDPFHNPMNSLPLFIYTAVRSGEPLYIERGYGAAALLVGLVLALFISTRLLARDRKAKR